MAGVSRTNRDNPKEPIPEMRRTKSIYVRLCKSSKGPREARPSTNSTNPFQAIPRDSNSNPDCMKASALSMPNHTDPRRDTDRLKRVAPFRGGEGSELVGSIIESFEPHPCARTESIKSKSARSDAGNAGSPLTPDPGGDRNTSAHAKL